MEVSQKTWCEMVFLSQEEESEMKIEIKKPNKEDLERDGGLS